jgi:hypothetical protein
MKFALVVLGLVACRGRFDARTDATADGDGAVSPTAIRVIVEGHGVAIVANQTPCARDCTYDVGAIDITTWAGEAWQFSTFSNQCGTAASCTVEPGSTITLTFIRAPITANLAFIGTTPAPRTGLAGLDATCVTDAAAAGLTGTFIALASDNTLDARDRFVGARGWVGVDGLAIFDTTSDFASTTRNRAITRDQTGVPRSDAAFTGSMATGIKDTSGMCSNWTSTTGQAQGGYSDWIGLYSISNVGPNCASTSSVFCLQTDRNVAVSLSHPPAPTGRYVFVTNASWTVGGGIAAADAFCAQQANAGGLAGTYKALLATTTETAAEHVGGVAGMWRRPDGIVVAYDGLDQDPLEAAIARDAAGAVTFGNDTMIGTTTTLTSIGNRTCSDWTNSAALDRADTFFFSTRPWNKNAAPPTCSSPGRIFCAQVP